MLWDVDLNHWSCSCLHDHVKSLGVGNLGQGQHVGCKWWHVSVHLQQVIKACHNEFPDLCLPYLFGQLPEGGPPLRYFHHQCCHVNTFSGEMLAKVDTTGIMDGLHHQLYISLCHLPLVLHHEFLQRCDGQPQDILVIICQEVTEHVHDAIYLVPVWLGLPLDFVVQSQGSHHHQGLWWFLHAVKPCWCSGICLRKEPH